MAKTAVIGAGLAGLIAARALDEAGARVEIFDKGRAPGGRLSTRAPHDVPIEATFDHGAQYFTARGEAFCAEVRTWVDRGWAARWGVEFASIEEPGRWRAKSDQPERYVGVPYMRRIAERLAHGIPLKLQTRVASIERSAHGALLLTGSDGAALGSFDRVSVNAPPAQAAALLAEIAPALSERAAAVSLKPCWATLVAFERPLELGLSAAFVNLGEEYPLRWIARESSKPHRLVAPEAWTLHAQHAWSRSHLEEDAETIADAMLAALGDALGMDALPEALYLRAHRWRYAIGAAEVEGGFLQSDDERIAVCGDWCEAGRVEGAYRSGDALGRAWSV